MGPTMQEILGAHREISRSPVGHAAPESMYNVMNILQEISDKHAPLRKLSHKKTKQLNKPWISNAILKSIKRKQKLFKTHFLSNDPEKVKQYKIYNNKLNRIKEVAKRNYFTTQFNVER